MAQRTRYEQGPLNRRQRFDQLAASLFTERATFDAHWQEIGDFLFPRRTRFFSADRNKGDKRNQKIIDSTARFAVRTLQSGLHAGLTSPARPWFKLTTPDPDLAERQVVKEWLHVVTKRMELVFASTNLYNMLPILYGDMGTFGTGAIAAIDEADDDDLFRCYAYPLGSYALGLDNKGRVATFVRDYELTVRQIVTEFAVVPGYRDIDWTRVSVAIKNLWDRGNYETPIEVRWVVTPNEMARRDRLEAKYLPWASVHYETGGAGTAGFLREKGFDSFPIFAPRWDITGEDTYGTDCPGMTALGDVKQLQAEHREKAKAIKKMVDPALQGPPEMRSQKVSILPGGINYVGDTRPGAGLRAVHEVNLNIDHLRQDINETQYRIQRAFYEDLFLMLRMSDDRLGADRPTAAEIQERHEEKLLALGPVLERTSDELLNPLIDRAFYLMNLHGLLPEPPREVQGQRLRVEFVSIMAQAQKSVGIGALERFLGTAIPLLESYPEAKHKIDANQILDNLVEMLGTDPRIVRTNEDAEQRANAQAQQEQAVAGAEQVAQFARATRDAASAKIGTGSALDSLLGAQAPGSASMPGAA